MYRLRTFGGLVLERDGVPLDEIVPQRKALVLLATLAVHGTLGRERLMALLWPESDAERARGSLKQAVHSLRRQLGEPELLLGTAELRLNPRLIECDVQLFLCALEEKDAEGATELYRGHFLEGVHLDRVPEFERWVDGWRDTLAARHRTALEFLAKTADGLGDAPTAVAWWRRLQGVDPFSSRVALMLMQALERAGDPASAVRHARLHEVLLREELSASPDAAVTELAARLQASGRKSTHHSQGPAREPPASRLGGRPLMGPTSTSDPVPPATRPATARSGGAGAPRPHRRAPFNLRHHQLLAAGILLLLAGAATARAVRTDARTDGGAAESRQDPSVLASVAVLPLVDLSAAGDQAYLADGIAEEILHTLASLPSIRVPSRTSSFHFRDLNLPISEIAARLGVDHVLEGSLRKDGDRVRVTAQLIEARTDRHLWSRTFDSESAGVFALQESIARTVAEALSVHFTPGGSRALRPTAVDPSAHDLYLRGLFHWNRRSAPDLLLAIRFFEEATLLDPAYARPWAGLALVYAVVPIGFAPPLETDLARSRLESAADRALALDSTLAEVHAARGLSYHFEWRWDDAEREFRRALDLNPRYATGHQWYGEHLAKTGRSKEGVEAMRRALELDPLSLVIRNDMGLVLLLDRQFDAARDAWDEVVRMDPSFAIPHYFLHRLALIEGKLDAAEESGRRWAALTGAATEAEITTLTRGAGNMALRRDALAILDAWASRSSPHWLDIAFYRVYLGAYDEAVEALAYGVKAGAPMMAQIGYAPWTQPLQEHPRFRLLRDELAFPE